MQRKEEKLAQYLLDVSYDLANYLNRHAGSMAQEIMSDITVLAYENVNKLSTRSYEEFTYWVFNVARKKLLEHYRKGKIKVSSLDQMDYIASTHIDDPVDTVILNEQKEQVIELLAQLKYADKAVYVERYIVEMTFQEIADKHGMSINTILTRHRRFLEKLRVQLGIHLIRKK